MFDSIALPLDARWPCTRRCIKNSQSLYGALGIVELRFKRLTQTQYVSIISYTNLTNYRFGVWSVLPAESQIRKSLCKSARLFKESVFGLQRSVSSSEIPTFFFFSSLSISLAFSRHSPSSFVSFLSILAFTRLYFRRARISFSIFFQSSCRSSVARYTIVYSRNGGSFASIYSRFMLIDHIFSIFCWARSGVK